MPFMGISGYHIRLAQSLNLRLCEVFLGNVF
ncbi:Uncharacterised protein [Vibrio cholerae]|nr:Uncharacterised protein [Vibrio cholerae]